MKPLSGENAPDRDVLDVGRRALVERDRRERLGFLGEALFLGAVHPAVDELAAVRSDELLGRTAAVPDASLRGG